MYDANAATGNEVLDVVLTEKSLLCEAQRIRLNCVADGTCLAAIEPGDLYALFSNLLDQAIDAAAQQQNDRRMIDLLVCSGRLRGHQRYRPGAVRSQSDHGRRHSYELKVARRVVQKYSGTMRQSPRRAVRRQDRDAAHQGMKEKIPPVFCARCTKNGRPFLYPKTEYPARNTTFRKPIARNLTVLYNTDTVKNNTGGRNAKHDQADEELAVHRP